MFYLKPVNQALPILEDALAQGDDPNLPTPQTPSPGVETPTEELAIAFSGRVVDSYTLKPIQGAVFVFLQKGVTIDDFINNPQENMLLSYGETDRNGLFTCEYVPIGASYSIMVLADGYLPIAEDDGIEIPADWYEDVDLGDIYLEAE